ncbi:integrase catalytic [Trichococcus palustris]|uniref:Integrase catalytic n=1 Tax=Trichococcus palustris TaxID=140314 RepID=A0A143Y9N2_9LACT|nr:site-specific integrase [Trichococcus palustris]CZQ83539.1 integrase catalytic [Trichococcus palustris]SFK70049.1 Site-specific recombinase XerD [Trichococcus palustris]
MWMEELPNGKYKFFERYENELFGKTKKFSVTLTSKSSRAQKEAKRMLDEKNQKFLKNFSLTKAGMNITFEDVANEWFPKYLQTVKASTGKTQRRYFSLVMNNFPKEALVSKIDTGTLQDYFEMIYYEKNYGFDTVRNIKSMVNQIFKYAKKRNYCLYNPVSDVELKKKPITMSEREKISNKFLDHDELETCLYGLSRYNVRYSRLCEFMSLTGLRIGETNILRASDIIDGCVKVSGTYATDTNSVADAYISTPKTAAAYRMVALSDRAIEIIRLFESENELYKSEYPDYDDKGYIFAMPKGTPILHSIINYHLKKVMIDMGIQKEISTHVFRHSHISILSELGIPVKAIMERVGHSDPKVTLEIYTHVTKNMTRDIVDKLNNLK